MRARVQLVRNNAVRKLCTWAYYNHPKGCPNFNKKVGCPPQAPLIGDVIDLSKPVYVVWNEFDFGEHVARMKAKHPAKSQRQHECCLYWQPRARKQLQQALDAFLKNKTGLITIKCPEAMGVDITATMKSIGEELQWPPVTKTYQVAVVGFAV